MKKIRYEIPPTTKQGNATIVGVEGYGETARENALRQYNSMLAHDGFPPAKNLPPGTKSKVIAFEED